MKFSDKIYCSYSKDNGIQKISLSDIPCICQCYKNDNFVSIIHVLSNNETIFSILDNVKVFNQLKDTLKTI